MTAERLRRVRGFVHGFVQGVGFRSFARRQAAACGVTGWVMNRPDGAVEFCAEGTISAVDAYLEVLGKGPLFASVERLEIIDESWLELPSSKTFEIRFS